MTEPPSDPAKVRFITLQLVRLGGFLAAGLGVWLWRDATITATSSTPGKALFIGGLFVTLVLPALLSRRWRSGT